jgi:predicted protein tyrosine phosphatase
MSSPIQLDSANSVQLLCQFVEMAQQKGAFLLQEAEVLKRAVDVASNNASDKDIDRNNALNLLIQGVQKGQRHGAYTLADAAAVHKVVQFISSQNEQAPSVSQVEQPSNVTKSVQKKPSDDDLSELSQPVPLKPKEI